MADDTGRTGSWWSTLPGLLTAAAAVITAITGLVAMLTQTGVFGEGSKTFVGQKARDFGNAVSPPSAATKPDAPPPSAGAKPGAAGVVGQASDAGTGIVVTPLQMAPFTGAIVTGVDGAVVKLRDGIKEWCQPGAVLKTVGGQTIEMRRMARFDVVNWNKSTRTGVVRVALVNGETFDTTIEACAMQGSNDLGDYRGEFDTIRSVVFVR